MKPKTKFRSGEIDHLFTLIFVVKAHLLLVHDHDDLGGSGVRDFGSAGPSNRLPLNYLTVVCWRGS